MNKKLSKEMSARTTDDSSTEVDDMHVSPAIAKPDVMCRTFFLSKFWLKLILKIIQILNCQRLMN